MSLFFEVINNQVVGNAFFIMSAVLLALKWKVICLFEAKNTTKFFLEQTQWVCLGNSHYLFNFVGGRSGVEIIDIT